MTAWQVLKVVGIVIVVLASLLFLLFMGAALISVLHDRSVEQSQDPVIRKALPYLAPIDVENATIRELAANIVRDCKSGDKTCEVHKIYRSVIERFKYYSDPRYAEFIQSPAQTLRVGGGDCEDLTILLNSYLENLGIETYLVMTKDHAYSLACGVDIKELSQFMREEKVDEFVKEAGKDRKVVTRRDGIFVVDTFSRTMQLDPHYSVYYGGDGTVVQKPYKEVELEYAITADDPINIVVLPTREDFDLFVNNKQFQQYPKCTQQKVLRTTGTCRGLDHRGIVVVQNPADMPTRAEFNATILFKVDESAVIDKLLANDTVHYYLVEGKKCVVLDATAGEFGYAGFDGNAKGEKVAINTVSKKYYKLN